MGAALDAREVKSAGNLVAHVEGDIEDVDGVLRITTIRLHYRIKIPAGSRERVERALATYAEKRPAYMSVKDSIRCTWDAHIVEYGWAEASGGQLICDLSPRRFEKGPPATP